MDEKINRLKEILKSYKSMIAGFSGGIDSTLLCYYGHKVLKDGFIAITAVSETLSTEELDEAINIAKKYNWSHLVVKTKEMENELFTRNTPEKCKWCKDIRFKELLKLAEERGVNIVAAGDNFDDLKDYRPGFKHAQTMNIKSPLIEAGLNKQEIRAIAKTLGLPNYDKPANPCLASRIPYGITITKEALFMIKESEDFIRSLGYSYVRVRHHNDLARIEIDKNQIVKFVSFHSNSVIEKLKQIGYTYIVLDLQGYRMGSLNEVITNK